MNASHKVRTLSIACAALVGLTLTATANAGLITNGDFSTAPQTITGSEIAFPNWVTAGVWGMADGMWTYDGTNEELDYSGSNGGGAILHWFEDNKASKGPATLSFDLNSGGDPLGVFVVGWNDGDGAPSGDPDNFNFPHSDEFSEGGSVDLLDEGANEIDHSKSNGIYVSVSTTGGYDTVELDLDFGTSGYDNVALWMYGARGGSMSIDNVDITLVPEPATLALLGLGGALMLGRRRRA